MIKKALAFSNSNKFNVNLFDKQHRSAGLCEKLIVLEATS